MEISQKLFPFFYWVIFIEFKNKVGDFVADMGNLIKTLDLFSKDYYNGFKINVCLRIFN